MECPKCGRVVDEGAFICPGCEFILDTTFLGDDITDNDESARVKAKKKGARVDFGEDALILGDGVGDYDTFAADDAGLSQKEVTHARFYIGGAAAKLLDDDAIPELVPGVFNNSLRLTPFERHVLSFVNGKRTVARIRKKTAMQAGEFKTSLVTLGDKGVVRVKGQRKKPSSKDAGSKDAGKVPAAPRTTIRTSSRTGVTRLPSAASGKTVVAPSRSDRSREGAVDDDDEDLDNLERTRMSLPPEAAAEDDGGPEVERTIVSTWTFQDAPKPKRKSAPLPANPDRPESPESLKSPESTVRVDASLWSSDDAKMKARRKSLLDQAFEDATHQVKAAQQTRPPSVVAQSPVVSRHDEPVTSSPKLLAKSPVTPPVTPPAAAPVAPVAADAFNEDDATSLERGRSGRRLPFRSMRVDDVHSAGEPLAPKPTTVERSLPHKPAPAPAAKVTSSSKVSKLGPAPGRAIDFDPPVFDAGDADDDWGHSGNASEVFAPSGAGRVPQVDDDDSLRAVTGKRREHTAERIEVGSSALEPLDGLSDEPARVAPDEPAGRVSDEGVRQSVLDALRDPTGVGDFDDNPFDAPADGAPIDDDDAAHADGFDDDDEHTAALAAHEAPAPEADDDAHDDDADTHNRKSVPVDVRQAMADVLAEHTIGITDDDLADLPTAGLPENDIVESAAVLKRPPPLPPRSALGESQLDEPHVEVAAREASLDNNDDEPIGDDVVWSDDDGEPLLPPAYALPDPAVAPPARPAPPPLPKAAPPTVDVKLPTLLGPTSSSTPSAVAAPLMPSPSGASTSQPVSPMLPPAGLVAQAPPLPTARVLPAAAPMTSSPSPAQPAPEPQRTPPRDPHKDTNSGAVLGRIALKKVSAIAVEPARPSPAPSPVTSSPMASPASPPSQTVLPAARAPAPVAAHRASAASTASFEQRRKAEKIFEQAVKDKAEGKLSSARMNAKLAMTYDGSVPLYKEFLDEMEKGAAPKVQAKTALPRELVLFEEASTAEGMGDYERAVTLLRQAVDISPKAGALHNRLGVVLAIRLKRFDEALGHLRTAIELEPNSVVYMNNYSKVTGMLESHLDKGPARTAAKKGDDNKVIVGRVRPKMF